MANYVSGVNPEILRWAREKAGYSQEEVARSLKKDIEDINKWETGQSLPTYNQLEKLAYSLYKRPIAVFFFPEPPEEPDPRQSFRTLPDFEIDSLLPDTRHALREARAMQLNLYELLDGINPSERIIFRDLQFAVGRDASSEAKIARDYLGIALGDQFSWRSTSIALDAWRDAVQNVGVFVFKRAFKQKDVSGFCLVDDEFPVIYLNNSTARTRQIFSLFHELAHVLLRTNGVTKIDDRYIASLYGEPRAIELFCNRFAAEFLVPSDDFDLRIQLNQPIDQLVDELSGAYNVSREVILRKLLERGIIDQPYYEAKVTEWLEDYYARKSKRPGGGNYYATQATYLGGRFLSLAFAKYYEGGCSLQQLADYLNVKAKSVEGLEQYSLTRASSG
ncbi:MAG TPA: ImmA/IrrE family metallo-endopeptidase [Anaerolineae bacterium]|nr:ImmA/IrrE family metallo-endopeptidase [Anaerolineae bacterium]